MGNIACCGESKGTLEEKMGGLKGMGIRHDKKVDLPNYVDPNTCPDPYERVKYMFPFYRTEITQFEVKLNKII